MAIELYATAGSVEKDLRNHVVIVVDALRATSVMVTAVEHGVRFIIPVSEVEEAVDMARQLGNQRVLLCGERQAKPIPEFHLSNSPLEYTPEMVADRVMVMTTTNGTRAILRAKDARVLLLGSFSTPRAVAHVARKTGRTSPSSARARTASFPWTTSSAPGRSSPACWSWTATSTWTTWPARR